MEYADSTNKHYGTAFFISNRDLLTAGHNLVYGPHVPVRVSFAPPGQPRINPLKVNTHSCEIIFNLYRADDPENSIDIAGLRAREGYHFASPLTLIECGTVPREDMVSVIGYPGDVARAQLLRAPKIQNNDLEAAVSATEHALPAKTLIESRGFVQKVDDARGTIHYEISTLGGMSGAGVLYKGNVCGNWSPDLLNR